MSVSDEFDYVDLVVTISQESTGAYTVSANVGEMRSHGMLVLPEEIGGVLKRASKAISIDSLKLRDGASETPDAQTPGANAAIDMGVQLFKALFQEKILELYSQTVPPAMGKIRGAVRIRLTMDPDKEGITKVASLPWELLAPEPKSALALNRRTPIVRSFDLSRAANPIEPIDTLRVLRIISNPNTTAPLDLDAERKNLDQAFGTLPNVEVKDLIPPTIENLMSVLSDEDFHVIHYMGHGSFAGNVGALLMHDDHNAPAPLTADALEKMMSNEPMTRLVYLSACRTAQVDANQGASPFAGVAPALLKAGVPAVVAMQYPISDKAAITFAKTFYVELMKGKPVDAAVSQARLALSVMADAAARGEWATPVLYMRASTAALFPSRVVPAPAPVEATATTPASTPAVAASFKVYIASTSSMVSKIAGNAASELRAAGVKVVDDEIPEGVVEHEAAIRKLASECDLFVHIMGNQPGDVIVGDPDKKTYVMKELDLGFKTARSQLVLIPTSVQATDIADEAYRTFLDALKTRPRDGERFTIAQVDRFAMAKEVLNKRDAIMRERDAAQRAVPTPSASGEGTTVRAWLDQQKEDVRNTAEFTAFLLEHGIEASTKIDPPGSQVDATAQFKERIRNSRLYIVVYGAADRKFVQNRALNAIKTAIEEDSNTSVGIFIAPPEKAPDQATLQANFNVFDGGTKFDDEKFTQWINKTLSGR